MKKQSSWKIYVEPGLPLPPPPTWGGGSSLPGGGVDVAQGGVGAAAGGGGGGVGAVRGRGRQNRYRKLGEAVQYA